MGYRIGLDIGITSVGWAVIEDDIEGKPKRIIDLGSRIFDVAENPKDGSALAKVRRDARGIRRRGRRKKHRIERTLHLLERHSIISKKEWTSMFENYNFQFNIYELRVKALEEKITNKDLARILVNFVKKRGYKSNSKSEENDSSNDAGKLLTATKENQNIMQEKGYRTIGELYLKDDRFKLKDKNGDYILDKNGQKIMKVRNTTNDYKGTALRTLISDEIKLILNKQKEYNSLITDEFIQEYISIFESQRNFDEGPGEPSPYAGNQIEKMLGFCTFEKEERRAPKATYTFEYFKLLQDINHIKIEKLSLDDNMQRVKSKRSLVENEKERIIELVRSKTKISYYDIRKVLSLQENERFNMFTYKNVLIWNNETNAEVEKDRIFKEFESYNKIKTALNRIEKNYILKLNTDELDYIGYALTVYKNDEKRISFLKENTSLPDRIINELLNLSFTKVGNLSLKSMKKIIPYLENGLTYDKAVNSVYEDFRGEINTEKKQKLRLKDLEEDISNPVVRRGISQAIKVLNAITLRYNAKYGKPDVVVIELAREMGRNFKDRNIIKKSQEINMKNNEFVKERIVELGKENPRGQDIVKYKLWQEQDGVCIYSGKKIPIENLFTEAVDVDHIIPYSMCFDDTYNNKVLVLASENRQKGNRVPYKYEKEIGRDIEEYEVRVNNIIKNPYKRVKLLREDFTREDALEWKDRNIQDTQYICKLMYNLVKNHLEFSNNKNFDRKVWTVNGAITSHIRKRLGIEKTRDGDIHHAIDAVVIAITTQEMINKLTKYYQYKDGKYMNNKGEFIDLETGEILDAEKYEKENGIYFPEPWPKFRKELEIRTICPTKETMISYLHNEKIFTYDDYEDVEPIFVSRMPKRKITGTAHLETVRGFEKRDNEIYTITKTELKKLKLDKDGEIEGYPEKNKRDDRLLYDALREQLKRYNNDGEKAFKDDFYKPRKDGSRGPLVKKVQIEAKTTLGVELKNKGFVANGDSVRIDVFYVEGEGYYFVPIYVSDTIKNELPNKACIQNKPYSEWKEMDDKNFIFSLYPKDLLYIKGKNKIKLNPTNKKDKQIEVEETMAYYVKAGISVAQITIQTHDNKYEQSSLGIKTLKELKKYEVDVLGNYHEVKLPEKRMPFNIKK